MTSYSSSPLSILVATFREGRGEAVYVFAQNQSSGSIRGVRPLILHLHFTIYLQLVGRCVAETVKSKQQVLMYL